jgi:probable rRNA maturation factor
MRLALAIQGRDRFAGLPARRALVRWVRAALRRDAELTLRFVGAAEGRRLNQIYRGRDHPTNVLTFDYARRPVVRADIVLCVPVIRAEAHTDGKSLRQHLAHLTVHAVLHAQGHTHDAPQPARRMEAREVAILSKLGFGHPYQPR